jgi:EpsI family protein
MNRRFAVSLVLGLAMAGAAALTGVLTPRVHLAASHTRFSLEAMIPPAFGGWRVDASLQPLTVDAERQGVLDKIYDQTLSRSYVNPEGQRVMLSIAYGGDQSKALQLHLPEVCYVAQGFELLQSHDGQLRTPYGTLPVRRLVAVQNTRHEPITYWITIGDRAIRSGIEQKLQRLAYGLSGTIPDGMLVRVSTIQASDDAAYRLQDRFVGDMLGALGDAGRLRLRGVVKG